MNCEEIEAVLYIIREEIKRVLYIYNEVRNESIEMCDINGNPTGIACKLTEDEIIKKVIEQV